MDRQPVERLTLHTFTFGRRYPKVIGSIGKFTLPFPLSIAQIGVFVLSIFTLRILSPIWAHLPGALNLLVYVVVPVGLAFTLRFARIEGRSPWRFLLGATTLLTASPGGQLRSKAVLRSGVSRMGGIRFFVEAGPAGSGEPRAESPQAATALAVRPAPAAPVTPPPRPAPAPARRPTPARPRHPVTAPAPAPTAVRALVAATAPVPGAPPARPSVAELQAALAAARSGAFRAGPLGRADDVA